MPIYELNKQTAQKVKLSEFPLEKDLQQLVEKNLEVFFNCRFVATEFSTGDVHSGRIDTLAISEDDNPVIIEYKKTASSDLVNQSLYYLHWIKDHKGDYEIAVQKAFGSDVKVDWSDIRVICLAPEFKKFDLHAVQVMGANIELWQYRLYENDILNLEEIYRRTSEFKQKSERRRTGSKKKEKDEAPTYTIKPFESKLSKDLLDLWEEVREYIISLDSSIEETPKKYYIAYRTGQNFVCIQTYKKKITLYLKLNPAEVKPMPKQARDVRSIGHYGTGDFEFNITSREDFEAAKHYIQEAYREVGG